MFCLPPNAVELAVALPSVLRHGTGYGHYIWIHVHMYPNARFVERHLHTRLEHRIVKRSHPIAHLATVCLYQAVKFIVLLSAGRIITHINSAIWHD